jgi:hypothetical protein
MKNIQQIKLFYCYSFSEIENNVNRWLEEHQNYIISITPSVIPAEKSVTSPYIVVITIVYEEHNK